MTQTTPHNISSPTRHLQIGLIMALFVILAIKQVGLSLLTLPFGNHDEVAHFSYTQYIVEQKKLPVFQGSVISAYQVSPSIEAWEGIKYLYNRRADRISYHSFRESIANLKNESKLLRGLGRLPITDPAQVSPPDNSPYAIPPSGEYKNNAAIYPPVYYLLESIPYLLFYDSGIFARLYAMRIFSAIFFLLTVFVCYKIARRIKDNFWLAFTVAAVIGFQPIFSSVASGVNNDALLTLCASLAIFFCLKLFSSIRLRDVVFLGLTLGLGLLSKPQFIVFLPLVLIPFAYQYFKLLTPIKILIRHLLSIAGVIILVSSWWFIWNIIQYGSLIGPPSQPAINQSMLHLPFGHYAYLIFIKYTYSFVTFFFNLTFSNASGLPIWIIIPGTLTIVSGLLLFFYQLVRQYKKGNCQFYWLYGFLVLPVILLEALYLYLFLHNLLGYGVYSFPVEGRYYFPVISVVMLCWMLGWWQIMPKRWQRWLAALLFSGMILTQSLFITNLLIPRFFL
ncbi:MAG: glycosyltransferase family 39 protein [Patescibacteria group bacterium]